MTWVFILLLWVHFYLPALTR